MPTPSQAQPSDDHDDQGTRRLRDMSVMVKTEVKVAAVLVQVQDTRRVKRVTWVWSSAVRCLALRSDDEHHFWSSCPAQPQERTQRQVSEAE
jgi:hypothetical protein